MKFPRCPDCGGDVLLSNGIGRVRQRRDGSMATVPDRFLIPTCMDCGHESMVPEVASALDRIIEFKFKPRCAVDVLFNPPKPPSPRNA